MKDDAEFSGEALQSLDWQRKYRVSLLPAFAADLPEVQRWADARWAEAGGSCPRIRRAGAGAGALSPATGAPA